MFKGFHHIGLAVKDSARSIQFYTEGLGGTITRSFPMGDTGLIITMIDLGGNAVVELLPRGQEEAESNPRWAHIALATEDVQQAYDLAIAAGATSRTSPKIGTMNGKPYGNAFVLGPDNEVIEFFTVE